MVFLRAGLRPALFRTPATLSAIATPPCQHRTTPYSNRHRLALGAQRRDVLNLVLTRGVILTCIGLVIGLPISVALAQLLAGVIFGVSAGDFSTFAGITLLLCAVTLLACYIPARRAMSVDPIVALRYE
jgi:ABC-type antimicrobial peptide transport system permease subunit